MLDKENIEYIDKISRKVMGFLEDEIISYDEAVDHYIYLINYYGTSLEEERFLNIDNFETLNYSFNYCIGFILEDYIPIDIDTLKIEEETEENVHYDKLLRAGNRVVERFYAYGLDQLAEDFAMQYALIGKAIYEYEKDMVNVKKYS